MITVTQHCKERYVERLKDKDNRCDILQYVAMNDEMITNSIIKMVEYGKLIYSGLAGKDNSPTRVYLNDVWILLTSDDDENLICITIYRIDLGLGDDFDRQYINGYLEKLNKLNADQNETLEEIEAEINTYTNIVNDMKEEVASHKRDIRALEETIAGYEEYIKSCRSRKTLAISDTRDIINRLIGKTKF